MYVYKWEPASCLCADCPQVCPAPPVYPDDLYVTWIVNGTHGLYIVAGVVVAVWTVALLTLIGVFTWRKNKRRPKASTDFVPMNEKTDKKQRISTMDYVGGYFEHWLEVGFTKLGTGISPRLAFKGP